MNPNDHPHGGGEGKAPVGRSASSTHGANLLLDLKLVTKSEIDKLIVLSSQREIIKSIRQLGSGMLSQRRPLWYFWYILKEKNIMGLDLKKDLSSMSI